MKEQKLEEVRDGLVASVGEFATSVNEKREADLEKITRLSRETTSGDLMLIDRFMKRSS